MAPLLQQIGRRQVRGDPFGGKRKSHRFKGGPHAFPGFGHRLVRQAHDREGWQAVRDPHLDIDFPYVNAGERDGGNPRDHSPFLPCLYSFHSPIAAHGGVTHLDRVPDFFFDANVIEAIDFTNAGRRSYIDLRDTFPNDVDAYEDEASFP